MVKVVSKLFPFSVLLSFLVDNQVNFSPPTELIKASVNDNYKKMLRKQSIASLMLELRQTLRDRCSDKMRTKMDYKFLCDLKQGMSYT